MRNLTVLLVFIFLSGCAQNVSKQFEKTYVDTKKLPDDELSTKEKYIPLSGKHSGFNYEGKVINPKCVNLLQTGINESHEYGIITKSIIIDSCQKSNLAFAGQDFLMSKDGDISYYEDASDGHSYFSYKVIGSSLNNVFVLFHSGYVGLYRLQEQEIIFDFSKKEKKVVTVLSKLSDAFIPCFLSAHIMGHNLIIKKSVWNSAAPKTNQCTAVLEERVIDLRDF